MTAGAGQLAEEALRLSPADQTVVLVEESQSTNLRFANNTLTTNGTSTSRTVTVIAVHGASVGSVRRSGVGLADLPDLVEAAVAVARETPPAEDAGPLVSGSADGDFEAEPEESGLSAFSEVAAGLAEQFDAAAGAGRRLYGFANQDVATSYLATSAGVRRRHVQWTGTFDMTGRPEDGSASAWAGVGARTVAEIDVAGLAAAVMQRLDWSARRLEIPAGRYQTILPPSAAADLLIELYWSMSARGAHEGRTAFARPGGGTRVGERLASLPVCLRSDPADRDLECAPFVVAPVSSEVSSVFDNGLDLAATDWIRAGQLRALLSTRHTAGLTGLPLHPPIDNLIFESAEPGRELAQMIAGTDRGLLLTCLWYIREVDPETLLVTGLTRDGVFLIEGGEVAGVVNNFRFNESPLGLLGRLAEVGPTGRTLPREFQEYLPRISAPALLVPDFNMSSVSQAS